MLATPLSTLSHQNTLQRSTLDLMGNDGTDLIRQKYAHYLGPTYKAYPHLLPSFKTQRTSFMRYAADTG